jgi:hypothetical protein
VVVLMVSAIVMLNALAAAPAHPDPAAVVRGPTPILSRPR